MYNFLIIDPQVDFCTGSLAVAGATEDMDRCAVYIDSHGEEIECIMVTLDSHPFNIAETLWWKNVDTGEHPAPFTKLFISPQTIAEIVVDTNGNEYTTTIPEFYSRSLAYIRSLPPGTTHTVWNPHCRFGSLGWTVQANLHAALQRWEQKTGRFVKYVLKGQSPWTEHFSAVRAVVPIASDPQTQTNHIIREFIEQRETKVAGEALSHCVGDTLSDVISDIQSMSDPRKVQNIVLIENACSNVYGCQAMGDAFITRLKSAGGRIISI